MADHNTHQEYTSEPDPETPQGEGPPPKPKREYNTAVLPWSDVTNAAALVKLFGPDLHYIYAWKCWLYWHRTHWERDETGVVMRRADATIKRLYRKIVDMPEERQAAFFKHIQASCSAGHMRGMVEQAQHQPTIPILPDALDQFPMLLNCTNGTVDLTTGILRPHDKADLLTKCLTIPYDTEALCPLWDRFLWRVMGGTGEWTDEDMTEEARQKADERAARLIAFLQRAVGYSLTGNTSEHCLFILFGTGRNGKGTFIETILNLLAAYAKTADITTFVASHKQDTVRNDLADLRGARVVAASETEQQHRLAEALVKRLTGGDRIKARFLFREHFEFMPEMHVWLGVNHKPIIHGTDPAIWERIQLIPFEVFLEKDERDKGLINKLKQELPGILAWAKRGCTAWQKDGLQPPPEVQAATAAYQMEMDTVQQFIEACCITSEQMGEPVRIKSNVFYADYKQWCRTHKRVPLSLVHVGEKITDLGFVKKLSNGVWYLGLTLGSGIDSTTEEDVDVTKN